MYVPVIDDEVSTIVGYLDQQLDAIRAAAIGLTDEQACRRPCRSALSIAGVIQHVAYGMRSAIARLETIAVGVPPVLDAAAFAAHQASFVVIPGEDVDDVVATFDELRPRYLAAVAGTDPGAIMVQPPAPWHGIDDARPAAARYFLVHQIEELARHAGHADILREQLDGLAVPAIALSQAGTARNEFFEPYVPAVGTIGGR